MIDQRVSEGEKINFFGKKAFIQLLYLLNFQLKFNLDIIPVFIERTKNNNFIIEFQKKLIIKNLKIKLKLTKKLNKILEKMIN